tara:strand:+ start:12836 stop:13153 length:318 start_codon:yes stop_codon:yes gene_type:complete
MISNYPEEEILRIIGRDELMNFASNNADSKAALQSWLCEVESESWSSFECIKAKFNGVDNLPCNKVVFHLYEGACKIMALPLYKSGVLRVENVGTPAAYSKWDLN